MALQAISAYNNIATDFSISTKSGDTITMSLYQNQEATAAAGEEGSLFSFRQVTGYDFQYVGNGIDEEDRKEIAAAMEEIRPMLEKFMEQSGGELPQPVTPLAREIVAMFPETESADEKTFLKDRLLDLFDDVAGETAQKDDTILQAMKRLLDEIYSQMERHSGTDPLYA